MEDDYNGTQEANRTPSLSYGPEPFVQEVGSEDGSVYRLAKELDMAVEAVRVYPINTLKAPSGVTRMAGANAYAAKFAISPKTMMMIPAHHVGRCKYANPSPSKPCRSDASFRPFLVITKLEPTHIKCHLISLSRHSIRHADLSDGRT